LHHLRVFGSVAYYQIHKSQRNGKFAPHRRIGIFVGYPDGTKGWKFWDPERARFVVAREASFLEAQRIKSVDIDDLGPPEDSARFQELDTNKGSEIRTNVPTPFIPTVQLPEPAKETETSDESSDKAVERDLMSFGMDEEPVREMETGKGKGKESQQRVREIGKEKERGKLGLTEQVRGSTSRKVSPAATPAATPPTSKPGSRSASAKSSPKLAPNQPLQVDSVRRTNPPRPQRPRDQWEGNIHALHAHIEPTPITAFALDLTYHQAMRSTEAGLDRSMRRRNRLDERNGRLEIGRSPPRSQSRRLSLGFRSKT